MAVTNAPVELNPDRIVPSRKERRANLAKAQRAMRKWKKKGGGTSVAPPEGLVGNVVDPGHETELTEDAKGE